MMNVKFSINKGNGISGFTVIVFLSTLSIDVDWLTPDTMLL
jgi:hypothetical protein